MNFAERKDAVKELKLRKEHADGVGSRARMGQAKGQLLEKAKQAQNIYETHALKYEEVKNQRAVESLDC